MDKETARLLFMDYMYGELEPERRTELENYLQKHPDLKEELDQLMEVRSMLSHLSAEDPDEQLVMMEPETDSGPAWWQTLFMPLLNWSGLARTAFATAFLFLLFFTAGALTDMNFSAGSNGVSLTFGEQTPLEHGISPQEVELMLQEVKRDNARLMAELLQASQQQQEEQFQRTLAGFADYINEQRYSDLQMLSSGLSSIEQTYYDRFQQTDQVLGDIIQTVSQRN